MNKPFPQSNELGGKVMNKVMNEPCPQRNELGGKVMNKPFHQ